MPTYQPFVLYLSQVTVPYRPYFYVACADKSEKEVAAYLMKKFSGKIASIEFRQKEDLDLVSFSLNRATRSYGQEY